MGAHPVPEIAVTVNGKDIPAQAYADLIEISVQDDTEALSACMLRFSAWDDQKVELAWVDSDVFRVGGALEVELGHLDALEKVFDGEITGLELEVNEGETPRFIVRGYDRGHRLMRGARMRSFVKMKDSDIAAKIAQESALTADAVDSGVQHAYVLQDGRSDLEFLRERAASIGYEVMIEGKTLHFRPFQLGKEAIATLRVDHDLTEFSARLSSARQVGAVTVHGWSPQDKKAIVGRASAGQETSMGETGAPKLVDDAFGEATLTIVNSPIDDQTDAEKIALGILERLALGLVVGEGACQGHARLRAGVVADVQGAGKLFSGPYYLTSVTHTYSAKRGFRTSFSGRRNAT